MKLRTALLAAAMACAAPLAAQDAAVVAAAETAGTPDERAAAMVAQMTLDEKLTLVRGFFSSDFPPAGYAAPPEGRPGSAGYVPGIPRLGIPPQWEADAGLGVAAQGGARVKPGRTALPGVPSPGQERPTGGQYL